MQCLIYDDWNHLKIGEMPRPEPQEGEVLVRIEACGLCGSELEAFKFRSPRRVPPLVLGHEYCGRVEASGPGGGRWSVGDRVVGNAVIPCGECVRCRRNDAHLCARRQVLGMHRPGAFAGWVCVPGHSLIVWPDGLAAREACLAEPLANGVHTVNLTRHLQPQTVLVLGAGPLGLLAQQAFQALCGARVLVSDLLPERRAVAQRLGAAQTFDARTDVLAAIRELTEGEGADVVIDGAGSALTKRLSLECLRPGGAAVWLGLHQDEVTFSSYGVTLPEKQILGTYSARLEELEIALGLIAARKVDAASWTESFALAEGVEAFHRMLNPQGADIKAVLHP